MKTQLNQIDPNQLLQQLHKLSHLANAGTTQTDLKTNFGSGSEIGSEFGSKIGSDLSAKPAEFGSLLSKAIDTVNQYQMEAGKAATQIETGDGGVSLVKAMIASQKSNIAFQSTVQVRNKLVSAYQDIMNMPI